MTPCSKRALGAAALVLLAYVPGTQGLRKNDAVAAVESNDDVTGPGAHNDRLFDDLYIVPHKNAKTAQNATPGVTKRMEDGGEGQESNPSKEFLDRLEELMENLGYWDAVQQLRNTEEYKAMEPDAIEAQQKSTDPSIRALTREDATALRLYTGDAYTVINGELRGTCDKLTKEQQKQCPTLGKWIGTVARIALEKLQCVVVRYLWRGSRQLNPAILRDNENFMKENFVFEEPGFMSTTMDETVAKTGDFAGGTQGKTGKKEINWVLKFRCPPTDGDGMGTCCFAKDIAPLSIYGGEKEMLAIPGTPLKVKGFTKGKDGSPNEILVEPSGGGF